MPLKRIPGIKHYKADDAGLRELATSAAVGEATLATAQRLAGNAQQDRIAGVAPVLAGLADHGAGPALIRPTSRHRRGRGLIIATPYRLRVTRQALRRRQGGIADRGRRSKLAEASVVG